MPDDLIIGDRISFANQFRIPSVSNLRCSWEIGRIGLLSCDIPEADLPTVLPAGVKTKDLLRRWVTYTHPTAGTWGGVIGSISSENGIVSIDAESWAAMLRGIVTSGAGAGPIVAALATVIKTVEPLTGIKWGGVAGTEGAPDDYTFGDVTKAKDFFSGGQDLYDAFLPAVMESLYTEYAWVSSLRTLAWNIDPVTRVFSIDPTYGRNLTQTVALHDRLHSTSSGWTDDVEELYNVIYFSATYNEWTPAQYGVQIRDCKKWGRNPRGKKVCQKWGPWYQPKIADERNDTVSATAKRINQASINQFGVRELWVSEDKKYPTLSALQSRAQLVVDALSRNEQLVTVEIADEGGIFSRFREGDAIGVNLTNSGRSGNMLARSRAYDGTRGTMLVSGEAQLN